MNYKAKCNLGSKENSGLMFILNEEYAVKKFNGNVFHKYVSVTGNFTNTSDKIFQAERLILKEVCEKHLKILK